VALGAGRVSPAPAHPVNIPVVTTPGPEGSGFPASRHGVPASNRLCGSIHRPSPEVLRFRGRASGCSSRRQIGVLDMTARRADERRLADRLSGWTWPHAPHFWLVWAGLTHPRAVPTGLVLQHLPDLKGCDVQHGTVQAGLGRDVAAQFTDRVGRARHHVMQP
jgi:hypothetical protein